MPCISGSESLLPKRCVHCNRPESAEHKVAVCTGCGHAYHLCCLKPPLDEVPRHLPQRPGVLWVSDATFCRDSWFCLNCTGSSNIDTYPIKESDCVYSLSMFEAVSKSQKVALNSVCHFPSCVSLWHLHAGASLCLPSLQGPNQIMPTSSVPQQPLTCCWQVSVEDVERKFWSLCQENDEVEAPSLHFSDNFPWLSLPVEGGVWK